MRKRTRRICLAAGLASLCLLLLSSPAALAAQGTATLTVKQAFAGAGAPGKTIHYMLTAQPASNPMPAGSGAHGYAFSITGTGEAVIGPIAFTQAGVYAYEISQATACPCPREAYALKIYVEQDLAVSVVALKPDGKKAADIQFAHACGEPAPPPEETTSPETTVPTTKPPVGSGPKTGDQSQIELFIALFCAAAAVLLVSLGFLLRKRKKGGNTGEA